MSNTNVNISNRLLTYVKHGVDITQDMKNIYSNSLILIGDEKQIYVPVLNAYVGIGTTKFQEAINSALNECPWEKGNGDFSIQSKNTGSIASGAYSVAEGLYTQTSNNGEHAEGKYNKSNTNTLSSIGIGNSTSDRKNAFEVDKNGYIFTYNISNYNIDYYNKRYNGTNPLAGENDLKTILDNKKDKILLEKTFNPYTITAQNSAKGYVFFLNVIPTSDNYFQPWFIHYKLYVNTTEQSTQGEYDCIIGSAGTSINYHVFNRFYSTSYRPIYYHLLAWHNNATKYGNRETNPIKIGTRIYSARLDNSLARTFKIEIIDMFNCTASFPENIETYDSFYTDAKYGYCTSIDATAIGLAESGDANTPNYYNYEYYIGYRIHNNNTPLYRYRFVGFDERNHIIPVTITEQTNATIIDKAPCNVPMIVSRGLALYNTTTAITSDSQAVATGTIYRDSSVLSGILPYNLNTAITANNDVYLVGNYNHETDEFTLDTSVDDSNKHTKYYNIVPIVTTIGDFKNYFETGKYYWYLGQIPTNASYFNFQQSNHTLFYFNGENLIPVNAKNVYDNPWERGKGDFSIQSKNTGSIAFESYSLAHGNNSVAYGTYSEAGGLHTTANSIGSHTEGFETITGGDYTYNPNTTTIGANNPGSFAHAEGRASIASGGVGSHAEGNKTVAAGKAAHAEGSITAAIGNYSHTEGVRTISYAAAGHAEGQLSVSYDNAAHAEGFNSYAISPRSHAEGLFGYAYGWNSHAEGTMSQALGDGSHAEGETTISYGLISHTEGQGTIAHGFASHAEIGSWVNTIKITGDINTTQYTGTVVELSSFYKSGHISLDTLKNIYEASFITWIDDFSQYVDINKPYPVKIKTINFTDNGGDTISFTLTTETTLSSKKAISNLEVYVMMAIAYGSYSHMESGGIAYGGRTHTEGRDTIAIGTGSHAEGHHVITRGEGSHGEGFWTVTYGTGSHVEGEYTYAIGIASHAEGHLSYSSGMYSHAEGNSTRASGENSHSEGQGTSASGPRSHAEGYNNIASGYNSHSEGYSTRASGESSHSEGYNTKAYGSSSHAEGGGSIANQPYSHAEGYYTKANGANAHAEGSNTEANGSNAHAEGYYTKTSSPRAHVEGSFNLDRNNLLHAVGNGNGENNRRNTFEILSNGKIFIDGVNDHDGGNSSINNKYSLNNLLNINPLTDNDFDYIFDKLQPIPANALPKYIYVDNPYNEYPYLYFDQYNTPQEFAIDAVNGPVDDYDMYDDSERFADSGQTFEYDGVTYLIYWDINGQDYDDNSTNYVYRILINPNIDTYENLYNHSMYAGYTNNYHFTALMPDIDELYMHDTQEWGRYIIYVE